ncbi:DUF695 domain-containing protein [Photobacterium halotolerans]|uniref:DUF695 domain-containing protein n=1 Tax=Photobacterium halotolerans TaxID=265726 RepID=A0A0F5VAH1_9GAMM|nr:DUF695 domain-containing protein [Photobacterium halotolerans]KKC99072.1 hypothetical protein KY46_14610 [Photobacterium halotolerans]
MLGKLFGRKKKEGLKENEFRIVLPEESYTLIEYNQEKLPCIAMVNSGLIGFEHREIFRWHLSVIIDFEEIIEKGMPSEAERKIVDPFCDQLEEEIKAGGNALFLARETWNKTRRLVWMVNDPEIPHQHLQHIIEHSRHPRPFDYRMEEDIDWEQPEWYLRAIKA